MKKVARRTDRALREIAYVDVSGIHGQGLFAVRVIGKGEYIGTFSGPRVKNDGAHVLWVYECGEDRAPVGRRGENMLRYLNHATPCNAAFDGFDLYAVSRIAVDEEITIDYGGGE